MKFKFDYDREYDSLFIYSPLAKSKTGFEIGNIIIDITGKDEIVAAEILDASVFLSDIISEKITKTMLSNIKECGISVTKKYNLLLIKFSIKLKSDRKIIAPLIVPQIRARK